MPDTKAEDIKIWLKQIRKDREWLAIQCLSSKRTVDNWLSRSRPIPSAKLALIKKLMIEYGHVPFVEQNTFNLEDITSISCTIPPHLRERFEKAAQLENISLEELLRRAVIKESNVILSSQSDSLDE